MKYILYPFIFLIFSCKNKQIPVYDEREQACYRQEIDCFVPERKINQYVYEIDLYEIKIKGEKQDFIEPSCYRNGELKPLTSIFKNIELSEICKEMGVQGRAFYSVKVDGKGSFYDFNVLKGVDICFESAELAMEKRIKEYEILSSKYHNSEIIFSYSCMLR